MAKVTRTKQLDAPAGEVWERIGDFHGLHKWVPGLPPSEADGIRRRFGSGDIAIVEELIEEGPLYYSYRITEGPLPIKDYRSTLRVRPEGQGSVVEWEGTFEPEGVPEEQAVAIIQGVYDAGLGGL